jgi:ABC-type uncharacterized transport system permease subunit
MALALNAYKTITSIATTSPVGIYTSPTGYSGIVLLAQVANVGSETYEVTVSHKRSTTSTEIVKDFPISANDTASIIQGKLVLEPGDSLVLSGNNAVNLKFIGSVLETLN